ncbi:MAG: hypothetical protein WBM32_16795 [Crocosphaera sp.]
MARLKTILQTVTQSIKQIIRGWLIKFIIGQLFDLIVQACYLHSLPIVHGIIIGVKCMIVLFLFCRIK